MWPRICACSRLTAAVKNKRIRGFVFIDSIWSDTLANTLSARKRARQAERHRKQNASQRSYVRSAIRKVLKAIAAKDKQAAEAAFREAVPAIDKSVAKGIMHKNKAARHKSHLNAHIKAL